jgi:hypothetical protein
MNETSTPRTTRPKPAAQYEDHDDRDAFDSTTVVAEIQGIFRGKRPHT